MKNIFITTHNCSREEHQELIDYLEKKCWDYKQKKPKKQIRPKLFGYKKRN